MPTIKSDRRFCRRIFYRSFVTRDHTGLITGCDDYKKAKQCDAMDEVMGGVRALCRECQRFAGGKCTHGWLPVPTMTPIGNMWTCRGEIPTKNRMLLLQKEMERSLAKVIKRPGIDLDDVLERIKVEHLPNGNIKMSGNLQPEFPEPKATRMQEMLEELRERLDARSKWPSFVRDQAVQSKPTEAERQSSSQRPMLKYDGASSEWRTVCGHVAKLESRLSKTKRLLRWLLVNILTHPQAGCRPDCPACAVQKFLENDDDKKER
jgi:hypothetical protein